MQVFENDSDFFVVAYRGARWCNKLLMNDVMLTFTEIIQVWKLTRAMCNSTYCILPVGCKLAGLTSQIVLLPIALHSGNPPPPPPSSEDAPHLSQDNYTGMLPRQQAGKLPRNGRNTTSKGWAYPCLDWASTHTHITHTTKWSLHLSACPFEGQEAQGISESSLTRSPEAKKTWAPQQLKGHHTTKTINFWKSAAPCEATKIC
jgi:hypothetical protein